jgi:hypothetical protein
MTQALCVMTWMSKGDVFFASQLHINIMKKRRKKDL